MIGRRALKFNYTCVQTLLKWDFASLPTRTLKEMIISVFFVMGKTLVAPIKTTTIPKLEFQAAFHAFRIKALIHEEHDITID